MLRHESASILYINTPPPSSPYHHHPSIPCNIRKHLIYIIRDRKQKTYLAPHFHLPRLQPSTTPTPPLTLTLNMHDHVHAAVSQEDDGPLSYVFEAGGTGGDDVDDS